MSRLVEMRQRIKTIQTIKKIIDAMRLASIATHTASKRTMVNLEQYTQALKNALDVLGQKDTVEPIQENILPEPSTLYILIGSQKGLCGNFNTVLAEYYAAHYKPLASHTTVDHVVIGKQLLELLPTDSNIITTLPHFTLANVDHTVKTLISLIESHAYNTIALIFNYPKTFFNHKPTTIFLSKTSPHITLSDDTVDHGYFYYESPQDILQSIEPALLFLQIKTILIQSLNAENAARFIAMDNATRNASDNLSSMRIIYNKLRQAEITKEINDLAANL